MPCRGPWTTLCKVWGLCVKVDSSRVKIRGGNKLAAAAQQSSGAPPQQGLREVGAPPPGPYAALTITISSPLLGPDALQGRSLVVSLTDSVVSRILSDRGIQYMLAE